jgi:hypothetical protein
VAGLAVTVAAQDVTTDYDKATDFSKYEKRQPPGIVRATVREAV